MTTVANILGSTLLQCDLPTSSNISIFTFIAGNLTQHFIHFICKICISRVEGSKEIIYIFKRISLLIISSSRASHFSTPAPGKFYHLLILTYLWLYLWHCIAWSFYVTNKPNPTGQNRGIYSQHKRKVNSLPSNPITISTQVESCILQIGRFSNDPVLNGTITEKTTFCPPEKAIPIPHTASVVLFLSAENIVIAHVFVTSEGVWPVRDPVRGRGRERETGDGHSARSCPRLDQSDITSRDTGPTGEELRFLSCWQSHQDWVSFVQY